MSILEKFAFQPRRLGLVIIGIVLLVLGFQTVRNSRIDALARAAADKKPDPAVVQKLASYRGARVSELLLLIAGAAPAQENRLAAIQSLVSRKDVPFISRLSELLVPPESFAVRKAVANALYEGGCSPECVKNVLYFEQSMAHGARPAEAVDADPPATLSEQEKELLNALDEVLKRNKVAVGLVLTKVYGLASDFPAPFAVQTVQRLHLQEACPLLMHTYLSVSDAVRASPEYKYVTEAVNTLQCPGPRRPQ
jgi:hypothetical protein